MHEQLLAQHIPWTRNGTQNHECTILNIFCTIGLWNCLFSIWKIHSLHTCLLLLLRTDRNTLCIDSHVPYLVLDEYRVLDETGRMLAASGALSHATYSRSWCLITVLCVLLPTIRRSLHSPDSTLVQLQTCTVDQGSALACILVYCWSKVRRKRRKTVQQVSPNMARGVGV